VTGDTPTIDDWAAQHARPSPAQRLKTAGLWEQANKGRQLGLTWPQITEWLALHGVEVTAEELRNALR